VSVGAQNAHFETKGAFTGEVSGAMLDAVGVDWVLIGHSERRQYFGETDATVQKKMLSLLKQGFHCIVCIGESREEREKNLTHTVLTRQLNALFKGAHSEAIFSALPDHLVIAYEPIWAIGTGLNATPEQAQEAHHLIREHLKELWNTQKASHCSLLYGGSVAPENIDSLLNCPDVDGALVGGASLKPDSFLALLKSGCAALGH
jgi:triosephosphate isomerase